MAGITQYWETVVIRKKAPTAAARKDKKAVNAARRAGTEIETVNKSTAGTNKAASSTTTLNTRKLDEETENLAHEKVSSELKKAIMQEYESGMAIRNQQIITELERALGKKIPELHKAIMQGRTDKKLTQAQLAQLINEKPQVIQEYESGKAIPNQQIITELESAPGKKIPELQKAIMQGRIDKKLTQAQLAQLINEKPQVIQEYESGKAPNQQTITKLERALGYVKSMLSQVIGVMSAMFKIIFGDVEREDSEVLREASKGEDAVAKVRKEVDRLAQQVDSDKVDDKTIAYLTEMLTRQLLTLDEIEAEGEGRNQRRMEVRRVQSMVESLDVLKSRNKSSAARQSALKSRNKSSAARQSARTP